MYKLALVFMVVFSLLMGCSSQEAFEPVPIDPGVDSCETCHMGIQDVQASSQAIMKDGTPKKFDDIGCLVLFLQENQADVANIYVHDHVTSEWLDMNEAIFVQDRMIETPMSYGFVAFSSTQDAEAFQAENGGKIYSSQDILNVDVKSLKDSGHDAGDGHQADDEHNTEVEHSSEDEHSTSTH